jgi:hypothetical protein
LITFFNLPPNPDPIFFTRVAASGFPAAFPRRARPPRGARPSLAACTALPAASPSRHGLPCSVLLTARPSRASSVRVRPPATRPLHGAIFPRVLRQGAASSRASSSRCGFPVRSPSGRGLGVACFPAPPSSRTASAQLFFHCSCNQVAVAPSSWLVLWSVSGVEAAAFFSFTETSGKVLPW